MIAAALATSPMSADEFAAEAAVSRETLARFETYLALLLKWQSAINLVGRSTLDDPWRRHFWDSAQLHPLIEPGATIVDLGSGAGFPGLVLAILGGMSVHLVEADQRKAAFLREVARQTGAPVDIHMQRAEGPPAPPCRADIVTARALASVDRLLELSTGWLRPGGACLFPRGATAEDEISEAVHHWRFSVDRIASRTDPSATILRLGEISHA